VQVEPPGGILSYAWRDVPLASTHDVPWSDEPLDGIPLCVLDEPRNEFQSYGWQGESLAEWPDAPWSDVRSIANRRDVDVIHRCFLSRNLSFLPIRCDEHRFRCYLSLSFRSKFLCDALRSYQCGYRSHDGLSP
jgi:hypothetical protein